MVDTKQVIQIREIENLILEYDWSKELPFQDKPKVAVLEVDLPGLFENIKKVLG